MSLFVSDCIQASAVRAPEAEALVYGERRLSYAALAREVETWSQGLLAHGIGDVGRQTQVLVHARLPCSQGTEHSG